MKRVKDAQALEQASSFRQQQTPRLINRSASGIPWTLPNGGSGLGSSSRCARCGKLIIDTSHQQARDQRPQIEGALKGRLFHALIGLYWCIITDIFNPGLPLNCIEGSTLLFEYRKLLVRIS